MVRVVSLIAIQVLLVQTSWGWSGNSISSRYLSTECPIGTHGCRRLRVTVTTAASPTPSDPIESTPKSDPFREATGIRPSLHPVTINALAKCLKLRARNIPNQPLQVVQGDTQRQPLQVAQCAATIALEAIQQRQKDSVRDGMILTPIEQQTVTGRVVGVVLRLPELEALLLERCTATAWVRKYNEWHSFGVLPTEEEHFEAVQERISQDPLFALNRAECLLGLFLHTIEIPQLKTKRESVPDNSVIDFLDDDRQKALGITTTTTNTQVSSDSLSKLGE